MNNKGDRLALFDMSLERYGISRELTVLMEECGELTQAASKVLRAPERTDEQARDDRSHLAEEIADVRLMCDKVERALKLAGEARVIYASKLDRLAGRLAAMPAEKRGLEQAIAHYAGFAKNGDEASKQMADWLVELRARRNGWRPEGLGLGIGGEDSE